VAPAILFLAIAAASGAGVPSVHSRWAAAPIAVDGRADEWAGDGLIHDEKSGTDFAFRNDGRDIYVLAVVNNAEAAKALRASGLKIFGRPGRRGSTASGVLFVAREVSAEAYIGWEVSQGAVLTEAEKAELRKAGRRELHLAFAVGATGSIFGPIGRAARGLNPEFAVAEREGRTTCQVPGGIGAEPGGTLRLSFDWGGGESREMSTPASAATQTSRSGYVSGTGRTWSQEFLDTFDSMSRPSSNAKKYSLSVEVKLAEPE